MSYNQKPPGSSGSGMGGGPPNGPNNMPQVAKTFAGIQQQMQNLVHGQNAIQQSSQADINAFLQQQRIQNMLKQQQQFLQFQHQMQQQQQQHQQQQHQHHNIAGGAGVGPGPVGSVPGVAGSSSGSAVGGGEPLALTRTPGAAELLNKTYQQQANGNPTTNPTFNQLQQTLQALPTNFVQQLQVFQYQMQAKQMQQQQQSSVQGQHGHGQQPNVQGVPPVPPGTAAIGHQQQQKHQNQHQQQQQQNALSRYLTAAAAQAAAVSGNKMSSATPPPPPPLTNQMKPPSLPPNTQITPVPGANITGSNILAASNPKISSGNVNTGTGKHAGPSPSISLTPSKPSISGPSAAHQQNKFTPPSNSGAKAGHMTHSQNLPKSTHGGTHTATSNTTSPAKTGTNTDITVAALKSPQSTPVQLTKQMPPTANTAATGNKILASASTTTGATSAMVSPVKSSTAVAPITSNILTTSAPVGPVITTPSTPSVETSVTSTKPSSNTAGKAALDEVTVTKLPLKSAVVEKEAEKTSFNDTKTPAIDSNVVSHTADDKKETEIRKEKKVDSTVTSTKPAAVVAEVKEPSEKLSNDLKSNSAPITTSITEPTTTSTSSPLQSEITEEKIESSTKSKKVENHDSNESEKKASDAEKDVEKNEPAATTDDNKTTTPTVQDSDKQPVTPIADDKKAVADLKQPKLPLEESKLESKEKPTEKDKDKAVKSNKILTKVQQSVPPKETLKSVIEADKSITCVEEKVAPITMAQTNPLKTKENYETNVKNSLEASNKNDTSESEQNKKSEKSLITSALETEITKAPIASTPTENKNDVGVKENETSLKTIKPMEISETSTSINKNKTEDNAKESAVASQKDIVSVVATPVKKVGRLGKTTKVQTDAPATPAEVKKFDLLDDQSAASSGRVKRKAKSDHSHSPGLADYTPKDEDSDRKSKRHRLKTILYQSPLPELAYITKLSASEASNSPKPMSNEDRLIVFYKNEYMAVRNAEGTFYLCQTLQNVYRTSPRISIRWLSEDAKDSNVFIPDFYDHTDIECVLTTVELKRIDKGHLRLPKGERNRIESILKKAIDVEKGLVPRPELTEENPDGLDISLYKDESQIEKKSALTEHTENQTVSATPSRKSRRGNSAAAASSSRKSNATTVTPSTSSSGNKRKYNAPSTAASTSSSRKSLAKKRKTLAKRKKKMNNSDDEDETSDDFESDTEYKPTQKRSSLNASATSKTAPRAQRSPLAKARAASPITPTTSRPKNVPQKITPAPSTSKASRGERAAKRKSITDVGLSEESSAPAKKPTSTSSSKSKASDKHTSEATAAIKSTQNDYSSGS